MSIIHIAEKSDCDGINDVISANRLNKNDVYKFPYLFDNCNDVLPTKRQIVFVAKAQRGVIGFLVLHDSDLFQKHCNAEFEMVVHPDYRDRKKHHGENMLKHAINYLKENTNVDILIAKVLKENISSINLLKKCGFIRQKSEDDGIGYEMIFKIVC